MAVALGSIKLERDFPAPAGFVPGKVWLSLPGLEMQESVIFHGPEYHPVGLLVWGMYLCQSRGLSILHRNMLTFLMLGAVALAYYLNRQGHFSAAIFSHLLSLLPPHSPRSFAECQDSDDLSILYY
jgi:hypothetical protein